MENSISVVVPVYNEEENLRDTVVSLNKCLNKIFKKYEIIIVESKSTDKTPQIADSLSKKNKHVSVIHQNKKYGYGNGLREGYRHCKYDLVWYMDGDCPYNLNVLEKNMPLIKNADAVIGIKSGQRESFRRWLFSGGYNILIRTLFGLKFRDINYSFKLLHHDALKKLDLKSDGWFIDGEILIELKRHNMKVVEIPIRYNLRKKGRSKVVTGPKVVIDMLTEIIYYIFRKKI